MKLSEEAINRQLSSLPDWERTEGKWISRKFRFVSFPAAVTFVNRVAETAEQLNHHPLIAIDYRVVTLRLTTWRAGGLTEEDFASALKYDAIYDQGAGQANAGG